MKTAYVTIRVCYEIPINYNTTEELKNAIENIQIPEAKEDDVCYKEDTFEFVRAEDCNGNDISLDE